MQAILAIDQGTTGTTAVLYDENLRIITRAYREFTQFYPQPGWVEHDPMKIWRTVIQVAEEITQKFPGKIEAIGLTNQRETTVIWDRRTGLAVHNAIVWQCRRTAEACEQYRHAETMIRQKTGLPVDAYFSATKIKWILDAYPGLSSEDLAFGTIDSWLLYQLTGGKVHATDYTNASRTLLYNIEAKEWDAELLSLFNVPASILPEVKHSMETFGVVETIPSLAGVPILAIAGDQQSALFGQRCFKAGQAKNTYGTGSFLVMNTEDHFVRSGRLISTLAVGLSGEPCYALEGSVFIAGAAIQWLRDELKILEKASDSEAMALSIPDNGGVYFVPSFVGYGAPWWNMNVRGTITGLTRGSTRHHIVRAALEAMAYQSLDVVCAMTEDSGFAIDCLRVDGGAVANDFLLQFQADILNIPVDRPRNIESTSLGAAMMCGLKAGILSADQLTSGSDEVGKTFFPGMDRKSRESLIHGWHCALKQGLVF